MYTVLCRDSFDALLVTRLGWWVWGGRPQRQSIIVITSCHRDVRQCDLSLLVLTLITAGLCLSGVSTVRSFFPHCPSRPIWEGGSLSTQPTPREWRVTQEDLKTVNQIPSLLWIKPLSCPWTKADHPASSLPLPFARHSPATLALISSPEAPTSSPPLGLCEAFPSASPPARSSPDRLLLTQVSLSLNVIFLGGVQDKSLGRP